MKHKLAASLCVLVGGAATLVACGATPEGPSEAPIETHTHALRGAPTTLWNNRSLPFVGRAGSGIVGDPTRNSVLVYGGFNTDGATRSDTMEWDGVGWIRRYPKHDPGPLFGPSLVYDARDRRVLLFGGIEHFPREGDPPNVSGALWEWRGDDWAPISTLHAPNVLACIGLAQDPKSLDVVAFGGFPSGYREDQRGEGTDGFWRFDGRDWSEIPKREPWPPARAFPALAFDPRTSHLILHGGFNFISYDDRGISFAGGASYMNDTWEWDGEQWRELPARVNEPAIFSFPRLMSHAEQVLLFADGWTNSALYALSEDHTQWNVLQSHPAKQLFSDAAWSPANDALLVVGGSLRNEAGAPTFDVSNREFLVSPSQPWRQLPIARRPPPRVDTAAALSGRGVTVMFGGSAEPSNIKIPRTLGDTALWDGGRWIAWPPDGDADDLPRPTPRVSHAMAAWGDHKVVLFGGAAEYAPRNDTWVFDVDTNRWQEIEVTGDQPSPRLDANMAPLGDDSVLLFGGRGPESADTYLGDTWRFDAQGWHRLSPTTAPTPRYAAATSVMADRVLLFGGATKSRSSGELWEFDGTNWSLRVDHGTLIRRRGMLAVDQGLGRLYTGGGTGSNAVADFWWFDDAQRTALEPLLLADKQDPPLRRAGMVGVSNPVTGGILMAFGESNIAREVMDDTWQLIQLGTTCTSNEQCGAGRFCTDGVCCEASSCGPCRTCANPARLGLCTAHEDLRAHDAECGEGRACNAEGRCRFANEQACDSNDMCASGTCLTAGRELGVCCEAEGCATLCADDYTLRGPDGRTASCGAYRCAVDQCLQHCTNVNDCADGFVCANNVCVTPTDTPEGDGGCGCRTSPSRTPASLFFALSALLLLRRRATCSGSR